jgi:regulator of sigma E protease
VGFVATSETDETFERSQSATTTVSGPAGTVRATGDPLKPIPLGTYVVQETGMAYTPEGYWTLDAVTCNGQSVLAVDGRAVECLADLSRVLAAANGGEVDLTVLRDGRKTTLRAQPQEANDRWGLGARYVVRPELRAVDALAAVASGAAYPIERSGVLLRNAAEMFEPESGVHPVSAAGLADRVARSGAWDVRRALGLLALLSVVVGLFNLLPLPGLDGGRLLIEVIEAARRRRLPVAWATGVQVAGMVVLLGMWVAVTLADLM